MKKNLFFVLFMVFALSAPMAFGSDSKSAADKLATTEKTENKLSAEELTRLTNRVEEIRAMDKSEMTSMEKRELRKELRATKENVRKDGGFVYIGGGTLILIIILVILLV